MKGNKKPNLTLFKYFSQYGIEDFKMILIKSYTVCAENKRDHKHLSVYEQLWINKIRCVNKQNCFTIPWLQKINFKNKYTYKGYDIEKRRQYLQANKKKISEYKAKRVVCICGTEITQNHLWRHQKTQKHLKAMEKQNDI
jgi:hypothetical protein